jgi:hypothetical protein
MIRKFVNSEMYEEDILKLENARELFDQAMILCRHNLRFESIQDYEAYCKLYNLPVFCNSFQYPKDIEETWKEVVLSTETIEAINSSIEKALESK